MDGEVQKLWSDLQCFSIFLSRDYSVSYELLLDMEQSLNCFTISVDSLWDFFFLPLHCVWDLLITQDILLDVKAGYYYGGYLVFNYSFPFILLS